MRLEFMMAPFVFIPAGSNLSFSVNPFVAKKIALHGLVRAVAEVGVGETAKYVAKGVSIKK